MIVSFGVKDITGILIVINPEQLDEEKQDEYKKAAEELQKHLGEQLGHKVPIFHLRALEKMQLLKVYE